MILQAMYYIAKIAQATGLTIVLTGFISRFPALINMKVFWTGTMIFLSGWIIQRFMLKNK